MKCPRCGLNNLEHVETCVKCGLKLVVSSLPENFSPYPPRAGKLQPLRQLFWRIRRAHRVILHEPGNAPTNIFSRVIDKLAEGIRPGSGSLGGMIMSFVVPGSGQLVMGRLVRGVLFLGAWLILLLFVLFAIITYNADMLGNTANVYLVCMCLAALDAMPKSGSYSLVYAWVVNICLAMLVWLGCLVAVNVMFSGAANYLWGSSELIVLRNRFPADCPLQFGDSVACRPEALYSRGSIVFFNAWSPYTYDGKLHWNHDYRGLDRIIGLPGELITVKDGIVMVDGNELPDQTKLTLNRCKIPDMEWQLSNNEYFIVTSGGQVALTKHLADYREATVVKPDKIRGRAVRILAPASRRRSL